MKLNDGLRNSLKEHLNWSKPRLSCFVSLLLALFRVQRMDLTRLAVAMEGEADIASRYRRLQRFFQSVRFDYDALASLIMQMFGFDHQAFYLTLDRTNWQWGKKNLNLLTLAVVYKGAAIPIYWLVLNKKGNSSQRERIAQLNRFISRFGRDQILGILGDREFIGEHWWGWLDRHQIPFFMRMKENQKYRDRKGRERSVRQAFNSLQPGEQRILRQPRIIRGQRIYLSGLRLDSGELLIIASNRWQAQPFEIYRLRWEIEHLFQCLKGRGFHMEATRLTHYHRIKKMMALLAIGFCWAHKTGEWKHKVVKPLKIKNHGRLEKSWFRYGLDELADHISAPFISPLQACRMLLIFLCPPGWINVDEQGIKIIDGFGRLMA